VDASQREIDADILIIGAGAAGLTAGIFAGERLAKASERRRVWVVDGSRKPGAKILVSGGSRCNVTNEAVSEGDFWGGPRPLIKRVLRRFGQPGTLRWFDELGVPLKLEATGKFFPESDSSKTVLAALLRRLEEVGTRLFASTRVTGLQPAEDGAWRVTLQEPNPIGRAEVRAGRVIVATGGLALPKSGSDGWGLSTLQELGHAIVPTTPALAPLVCDPNAVDPDWSYAAAYADWFGLTMDVRLALEDRGSGKRLEARDGSLVFTHFGLSGPAALDLSRHFLRSRLENPSQQVLVRLGLPSLATYEAANEWLQQAASANPRREVSRALEALLPRRLAEQYGAGLPKLAELPKGERKRLARALSGLPMPVVGDRGYTYAETTAGGVDLRDVDVRTMASKRHPTLYLAGEVLDVDGRLGGFNFTWAWSTGYIAGQEAAAATAVSGG